MNQTLADYLNALKRWAVLWVSIVAMGTLVSLAFVVSKPHQYQSSAVIQIEQASVKGASPGTRGGNAHALQTLQIIEQRVMARDNLIAIIEKFGLYDDVPDMTMAQKVYELRLAAQVIQIADPSMQWRNDLSPTALNVSVTFDDPELATAVANELVNNVLKQNELRRLERTRETLAFYDSEEKRVGKAIVALEERIASFKRENSASLPGGLEEQRERLADIRAIELELDSEIVGMRSGQGTASSNNANRIRRLENQKEIYHAEAAELSAAIARAPEVEQILNTMQRQLQKLTDQFLAISASRADAELGHLLEAGQKGERFQVLETALVPERPVSSKRKRNLVLGIASSIAFATSVVVFLESRSTIIRSSEQLVRKTGLKPVVTIPMIETGWQRRRRTAGLLFSLLLIGVVFAAASFFILDHFGIEARWAVLPDWVQDLRQQYL